ncbi:hypothetical protein [Methylobacterium sp. J-077]|uniref:hypothetical protein n=1 Tax=Methylobacterium sp. J-077 TaxID=2836656 RepID=UPI001FB8951B|nr:hypothetical protein [Methylobacterium sp. J-077]MCJ2123244.1 hypothetical protein [Methylobacterium sp. J-077]
MNDAVYDLTLERIALIRRMVVAWNGAEPGAPMIHPEAPYGSHDRDGDIANVTGDDDGAEEEHRALEDGIAVFSQNAKLKPGRYQYHNPLAKLDCAAITDVFRDVATGETPEHITFAVTDEHLALIPRLNHVWDETHGVPRIDPDQPYGGTEPYTQDMGRHLGGASDAGSMARLHREMQPAFQIFLRYADLGPGLFRRNAASAWEPA